jgi:hypothetical protein
MQLMAILIIVAVFFCRLIQLSISLLLIIWFNARILLH